MSQYLRFVLERAKVSLPTKVCTLRHALEWANRQIVDEFRAASGAEVQVVSELVGASADLLVLPYKADFAQEKPGGVVLYRQLRSMQGMQVMLYGLSHREIVVIAAEKVLSYYYGCRLALLSICALRRLHLLGSALMVQRLVMRLQKVGKRL